MLYIYDKILENALYVELNQYLTLNVFIILYILLTCNRLYRNFANFLQSFVYCEPIITMRFIQALMRRKKLCKLLKDAQINLHKSVATEICKCLTARSKKRWIYMSTELHIVYLVTNSDALRIYHLYYSH